jgi:hypothetical protein
MFIYTYSGYTLQYEEKGSDEIFIPFPLFATATMGLLFYEMYKRTL